MATPRGGFRYNERAGRYISANGRFVSNQQVRAALDAAIDSAAAEMRGVSKALQAGTISLAEWQLSMEAAIKSMHINGAALAKGGYAQMSQADYGRAGREIRRQYEYLRAFAADIASGKQKLDGRFIVRSEMYIQSARGTYHEEERRARAQRGFDEEMRVRHSRDSCPTCVRAAGRWAPIGTLPRIGESECRTRCLCSFSYRNSATGEEVAA